MRSGATKELHAMEGSRWVYTIAVYEHGVVVAAVVVVDVGVTNFFRLYLFLSKGGLSELGEQISEAAEREVFEETGIHTQFQGLLAMASTHPYRFGKSNIYMVCCLMPTSQEIAIQDTAEIADAKWTTPDAFLQDDDNSMFNKYLVKSVLGKKGLAPSELDLSQFSNKKHEGWLAVE